MLYLIGLGLYDEQDISSKGLRILKKVDKVYAEFYTGIFSGNLNSLKRLIKKDIVVLSRKDLEENLDKSKILNEAKNREVALLVPGDPMVATTHISIILKAQQLGIKTKIIHASSIYSAIGETGLQIYKFGRTSSIAFPEKNYFPQSFYDVLKENLSSGLHSLFLLDIKVEKKQKKFMSINDAIKILLEIEKIRKENLFTEKTFCVGVARLGSDKEKIKAGKAEELVRYDFGKPPHVLVIPGRLHFMEEEALMRFK